MAKQPKKKTRVRKKTRVQKKPVQKRRAKKTLKRSNLKKNIFIVLGVVLLISMVAFGYFLGQYHTNSKHDTMLKSDKDIKPDKINPLFDDLSAIKVKSSEIKKEPSLKKNIDSQKDTKKVKITQKQEVKKSEIIALADRSEKPKLVIIIDDVFKKSQLRDIQALKMKITPSIFPPFALSMKSHTLARGLKHYMIHLPMESGKKKFNAQFKTLKTSFSKTQIEERVKELRKLFPTARYVNNHTGSVFTNDYQAMYTLYAALRKEGFVFVDSRTIGSTKVRKIAMSLCLSVTSIIRVDIILNAATAMIKTSKIKIIRFSISTARNQLR